MTTLIPVFPETVGDSVEFTKDGFDYRLLKQDEDLWLIHAKGVSTKQFELRITNRRNGLMDVGGTGHVGPITGLGASEFILFDKLF